MTPPQSLLQEMPLEFKQDGGGRPGGGMPKSLSTGSFQTGQLAPRLSLPTGHQYSPDEEDDMYIEPTDTTTTSGKCTIIY